MVNAGAVTPPSLTSRLHEQPEPSSFHKTNRPTVKHLPDGFNNGALATKRMCIAHGTSLFCASVRTKPQ